MRVEKVVNSETTRYLYEYQKVVLEQDGQNNQTAWNVYGSNLISRKVGTDTLTYMYNGHADVTALLDTTGNLVATYYYDAFGNILEKTGTADNNILYSGYQYDEETGLYYLNARMYDPITARFLQKDTYRGEYNDPLSLNLYTYCANNPIIYSDPTGHFFGFSFIDQQLKQLQKTADWFLNDTKIGQSINKNVVKPVKDLVAQGYKAAKKKALVAVGIFDGLREETKSLYQFAVSMDPMSPMTKLSEAISNPKGTIAKVKSTATAVKNIVQDPKGAATETWNDIKSDVVGYVNGDILYGDAYTRAKFGTRAVVTVASLFVGVGEVKAVKGAMTAEKAVVNSIDEMAGIGKAIVNSSDEAAALRSRVINNIADSKAAREASNFSKYAEEIGSFENVSKLGKYDVGIYNEIRGISGLDAHHVGQKALMKDLIPGYNPDLAPSILVPKVGHTLRGPNGIVSRVTNGITNARQLIARDIIELRRVYPDIPITQLQKLIDLNKELYPIIRGK